MYSLSKTPVRNHRGFTLIELVAVIILLGIMAVYIAPKFSSRSGFTEFALRDQFISSYRYAQQRAMYDHSSAVCYSLSVTGSGFEPQRDGTFFGAIGQVTFEGDYAEHTITPAASIYFDGLGNAYLDDCSGTPVTNPYEISMSSSAETVTANVYPTGFIKAVP